MHFKDTGIIISKRALKESAFIVTVFTNSHGLYSGVASRISKKNSFIYQEGNIVDFFWNARLHEHIGIAKCELIKSYSSFLLHDKTKLYAFNSIIFLIKTAFQERENHSNFFVILAEYLSKLIEKFCFRDYINFELSLLEETGYHLELNQCGVTKEKRDLCYVSPKSGRAICRSIGDPYKDKLLILPDFLTQNIDSDEIPLIQRKQAFTLTNYFFNRYILPDNKSSPRTIFIDYILFG